MKKLILVLCASISISATAQIIIVDNTAILQRADILTLTKEVFKGISAWRVPMLLPRAAGLESKFFALLNRMPLRIRNTTKHGVLYQGKSVPRIMEQWTINTISSKQTLNMVNRYIQSAVRDKTQQILYKNIARMTFDPNLAPKLFTPDNQLLSILSRAKSKGHTIILGTNWNAQVLKTLTNRFRSAYQLFDDTFISSPARSKPQKAFFDEIFQKHGVSAADCIVIETEQKFVQSAQQLGIKGVRHSGNHQALESSLRSFKAL